MDPNQIALSSTQPNIVGPQIQPTPELTNPATQQTPPTTINPITAALDKYAGLVSGGPASPQAPPTMTSVLGYELPSAGQQHTSLDTILHPGAQLHETGVTSAQLPPSLSPTEANTLTQQLGGHDTSFDAANPPQMMTPEQAVQFMNNIALGKTGTYSASPGSNAKGQAGSGGDVQVQDYPPGYDPHQNYNNFIKGQCTSYASWYWTNVLGKPFVDTGNGNAKNWPQLAQKQGYSVTNTPEVNDIVSWPGLGSYGHVAIVQGVNNDGTINVSEMNYKPGKYTVRQNVSPTGAVFIK